MKKNGNLWMHVIAILLVCMALSGCALEKNPKKSEGDSGKKESPEPVNLLEDSQKMRYKRNEIEEVPGGYVQTCKNSGTIEILEYTAKDYTGSEKECDKRAKVYLPYGYDEERIYPVFYLMHGGGDDESWYFGETDKTPDSTLGCLLDHMIAGGELEPCIVCTPTYKNEYCQEDAKCTEVFYKELVNDLIPALEGKYATAFRQLCKESESVDEQDSFVQRAEETTRLCRAFGGFSMGSLTTWKVFQHSLKEVGFFMPVSGEDWGVSGSEKQAEVMVSRVKEQQILPEDFRLFAGCGGESDLAYTGMVAMLEAMRQQEDTFRYTEDFSTGNFYYEVWEKGGHDVNTVCTMVYNGLPQFFEKEPDYLESWAESILTGKLPQKMKQQDEYSEYGKWVTKSYYSQTAERETNINVLLPAYYDKERTYPVLYLLHGYFDDENWMKDHTDLKRILGNMMAQGLTKEMIVVCPYIFCSKESKTCTEMNLENSLAYDNFIHDLEKDVMPFIEKTYSVAKGKENTAIAGFSMGGREALYIGIRHPEQFGYVGAVCPAPGLTPGVDKEQHPGQLSPEEVRFEEGSDAPYLIYLAGAEEDAAVGDAPAQIHDLLEHNSVNHIWQLFQDTGHDQSSVEIYLYNYLQMLFK
ncbi:MAG: hypothetical protein K2J67_08480 [Lachnospiraceae bacterium]|nr:hypothetical protein [Lachnospiraceae bacterium]